MTKEVMIGKYKFKPQSGLPHRLILVYASAQTTIIKQTVSIFFLSKLYS